MQHKIKGFSLSVLLLGSLSNLSILAGDTLGTRTSNLPKGVPAPKAKPMPKAKPAPKGISVSESSDHASVRLANFLKEKLTSSYTMQVDNFGADTSVTVPAGSTVSELLHKFALLFPTRTYQERQQAGRAMKLLMTSLRGVAGGSSKLLDLHAGTEPYAYYFKASKDSAGTLLSAAQGSVTTISLLQEVMRIQKKLNLSNDPVTSDATEDLSPSYEVMKIKYEAMKAENQKLAAEVKQLVAVTDNFESIGS